MAKDGQSFTFRHLKATEGSVPSWIILASEPVPPVDGIDMTMGAQLGFFGPMNPTNLVGATWSNFCSGIDQITRLVFGPKKLEEGGGMDGSINKKWHSSVAAYAAIRDIKLARPKDFFDLQISPKYISNVTQGTNYRASAEGVGIGVFGYKKKKFGDYVPFDDDKIYKYIGLIFANGLNPWLFFETWFTLATSSCLLMGNSLLSGSVMDKSVNGMRVPGIC